MGVDVFISLWVYVSVAVGLVALYLWLGSIWACLAVFAFINAVYIFARQTFEGLGLASAKRLARLDDHLTEIQVEQLEALSLQLESLFQMAEFLGKLSNPSLAVEIGKFSDEREDELRRRLQEFRASKKAE